jgi:hypothetical protein
VIAYQWISAVVTIVVAVVIIWLVRRSRLHPALATWWVLVAIAVAAVGMCPEAVDWVAARLGVGYSPTLVGLIGVAVLLIKILKTDIERTKEQHKVRILAQKVALLEAEQRAGAAGQTETAQAEGSQSAC